MIDSNSDDVSEIGYSRPLSNRSTLKERDRDYHNFNFMRIWPDNQFDQITNWFWFKFNNLGLVPGMALKLNNSVTIALKLKLRIFSGLIPSFGEIRGDKLIEGDGLFAPPPTLNRRVNLSKKVIKNNFFLHFLPSEIISNFLTN